MGMITAILTMTMMTDDLLHPLVGSPEASVEALLLLHQPQSRRQDRRRHPAAQQEEEEEQEGTRI